MPPAYDTRHSCNNIWYCPNLEPRFEDADAVPGALCKLRKMCLARAVRPGKVPLGGHELP